MAHTVITILRFYSINCNSFHTENKKLNHRFFTFCGALCGWSDYFLMCHSLVMKETAKSIEYKERFIMLYIWYLSHFSDAVQFPIIFYSVLQNRFLMWLCYMWWKILVLWWPSQKRGWLQVCWSTFRSCYTGSRTSFHCIWWTAFGQLTNIWWWQRRSAIIF